jgi:hypothetical protein
MKSNTIDIVPSLSLSRRPPKKKELRVVNANETKLSLKRPSIPIPSFQAERENLERIFDSESDESPQIKKKPKKRKRSFVPIPSFSSADDDVLDDDSSDILNTKPIFACDTRKLEHPKESSYKQNQKNVASNDLSLAAFNETTASEIHSKATERNEEEPANSISVLVSSVNSASPATKNNLDRGAEYDLTENDVLQLAVGIARNLDPVSFSFKQVQHELQVQTGDAWKRVKLAKLRQFVLQQLEPTEEALHAAIDTVFLATDIQSSTKKQFIAQVQEKFPIPFSQLCRAKIIRRLTSLLNKETSPTVVAMANRDSIENKTTMPPLTDEIDPDATVINDSSLTDCVAPFKNITAANEMLDLTDDNKLLPALFCESNSRESGLSALPSDVPKLPDKPNRGRDCNVATSVVSETASSSSEEKMPPTRARKARKTVKADAVETEAVFAKTTNYSPPEKISRKRKATCQLCVNCPCALSIDQPKASLSEKHSDAAVEKKLIKRLQKLEKIADYYEEQTDSVRRLLKKHRRDIWKKREAFHASKECANRPRFLPDAGELGEVMDSMKSRDPLGPERIRKAQVAVFARAPVVAQSTLTQLLGGITKPTRGSDLDRPLDNIVEETEVDLKDEELPASDGEDEKDCASIKGVVSEGEAYRERESIPFSRVECMNGREHKRSPTKDGGAENSMWISMLTGKFSQCLHNLIDNSEDVDDSSKLENLFEMIDGSNVAQDDQSCVDHGDAIEMSMLSQRSQKIAQSLIESTKKDPTRASTLERRCPQWKENILYALHQRNSEDVAAALEQIKGDKSLLYRKKALLSRAIEERTDLLNLYEEALNASLSRLSTEAAEVIYQDRESFSPSKAKDSTGLGHASEIPLV